MKQMIKILNKLKQNLLKKSDTFLVKEFIYLDLRYSDCDIYRYYILFNVLYFKKFIGSLSKNETKNIIGNMLTQNKNLKIKWKIYETH